MIHGVLFNRGDGHSGIINAKFNKLKIVFDDVNKSNPIAAICIQELWGHKEMEMSYISLPKLLSGI